MGAGKIENFAAAFLLYDRPDGTGAEESSAKIIVQLEIPISQGKFVGGAIFGKATGEVDKDVNSSIFVQRLLNQCAGSLFSCQISRDGDDFGAFSPQFPRTRIGSLGAARADSEHNSLPRKASTHP